jgi:hypothetical protein
LIDYVGGSRPDDKYCKLRQNLLVGVLKGDVFNRRAMLATFSLKLSPKNVCDTDYDISKQKIPANKDFSKVEGGIQQFKIGGAL